MYEYTVHGEGGAGKRVTFGDGRPAAEMLRGAVQLQHRRGRLVVQRAEQRHRHPIDRRHVRRPPDPHRQRALH